MKTKITLFVLLLIASTTYAQDDYYFNKVLKGAKFEETVKRVKSALKEQGFSVITEIDMDAKIKEKIGEEMKPYKILGACNAKFAYKSVMAEDKIGIFLPCKLIIKENDNGDIEVVSVNPKLLMGMLENDNLSGIADDVTRRLKAVVDGL